MSEIIDVCLGENAFVDTASNEACRTQSENVERSEGRHTVRMLSAVKAMESRGYMIVQFGKVRCGSSTRYRA